MKKVLTILAFIACLQSYAQTIVVKDKITLQPLANVRILKSGIYDAVANRKIVFDSTNAKGEFKFIIQFNPLETFKFLFEDYYTEIYTGEALEKTRQVPGDSKTSPLSRDKLYVKLSSPRYITRLIVPDTITMI